jgi:hypothetical protein
VTCNYHPYPLQRYFCSDNTIYTSYAAMNTHYTATPEPAKIEMFIPETTFLYVTGGSTETYN